MRRVHGRIIASGLGGDFDQETGVTSHFEYPNGACPPQWMNSFIHFGGVIGQPLQPVLR